MTLPTKVCQVKDVVFPVAMYGCESWTMKKVKVKPFSCVRLFATPWTVTHQAPPSMGFPRQEYWSGLLFSPLGDLPHPGIKPMSLALAGGFFTSEP